MGSQPTTTELMERNKTLAAELAQWKNDNLEIAGKFTKANYRIRELEAHAEDVEQSNLQIGARAKALEADRDQISLTLDVAKADRDKWFNRAKSLEAALETISNGEGAGGLAETERLQEIARAALPKSETPAKPEPNFLFDTGADFCDRHETAFKIGERCPKCAQSDRGSKP